MEFDRTKDPRTYRELARKFWVAALRAPRGSLEQQFNNEQGDLWDDFAARLERIAALDHADPLWQSRANSIRKYGAD